MKILRFFFIVIFFLSLSNLNAKDNDTRNKLTKTNLQEIKEGINLDNIGISKAEIHLSTFTKSKEYIWDITLREGKNKEIKRIFNFYK